METATARAGVVIAVLGAAIFCYMAATHRPYSWQKPHSAQYYRDLAALDAKREAQSRKALADALNGKYPVAAECAPEDDACEMAKWVEETGIEVVPIDSAAAWTPATYSSAWWNAMTNRSSERRATIASLGLVALGVYLWLLHAATLGRVLNWIRHGHAPRDR